MSLKENTLWLEKIQEEFAEAVANKEWHKIQPIYIAMENEGFSSEVVELSNTMTEDECDEYRNWDIRTNGDTETQMDDDS